MIKKIHLVSKCWQFSYCSIFMATGPKGKGSFELHLCCWGKEYSKEKKCCHPFGIRCKASEVCVFVLDVAPQTYMCYWIVFLEVSITPSSLWGGQGLLGKTYCSHLSLNGHLYEMDTLVKLKPRVGPCFFSPFFDCV